MRFEGSTEIQAPRDRVWAFLIDPTQVGSCGPGVQSVEVVDDRHFRGVAKVGIGIISARFTVAAEFVDVEEPDHATIRLRGQAPGSAADATAAMRLRDAPAGGTVLGWTADVAIQGRLASVGSRLIEGTATKLIGQTFDCIRSKLEA
jgi:carbon monoxide dehydrogenase subunit G